MFSSNGSQVSNDANYIEDVFSTYLFTGTGSATAINNGIDLSTKGGLVWIKDRNSGAMGHALFDTARGGAYKLQSQSTGAQSSYNNIVFGTTGFTNDTQSDNNNSGTLYASWTFRKQPKFFDIQTITHTSGTADTVDLSGLGTVGCVIVKQTNGAQDWFVWHRSLTAGNLLFLNGTVGQTADNNISVSGTTLTMASGATTGTYIVYAYAHDAGGFGLTGTDNVISCGSFTTDGSGNATVNLGYEPQWLMIKNSSSAGYPWYMFDNMRGMTVGGNDVVLQANSSGAESNNNIVNPSATGFSFGPGATSNTYIYIAIRRGPMKVPTDATKVYDAVARTGTGATASITGVNFPPDFVISDNRDSGNSPYFWDRLRGAPRYLNSTNTAQEDSSQVNSLTAFLMNGISVGSDGSALINGTSIRYINWFFQRAPSFFDEVCFPGSGAGSFNHNLGAVPELIIVKQRATAGNSWGVYSAATGNNYWLALQSTMAAVSDSTMWNDTTPTSTTFTIGSTGRFSGTCVAYLFATCAGVSKVGSYTGTGTTKQIDCGFAAGARFVLIKRTDSTGDWYVWDTARGIVSGNDPYLLLNSAAAEVTSTDYIDAYSAGFELSSTAPAALNASGGTYIFLAIA